MADDVTNTQGEKGDTGKQGERGPSGRSLSGRIILIVAITSMLLSFILVGALGLYVQVLTERGAHKRENICEITEKGDQFLIDVLAVSAARPDDSPAKITERNAQVINIKSLIHQNYETCSTGVK